MRNRKEQDICLHRSTAEIYQAACDLFRLKTRRNICYHCGTTETPLWRRGSERVNDPNRELLLCNACGLRLARKEIMYIG